MNKTALTLAFLVAGLPLAFGQSPSGSSGSGQSGTPQTPSPSNPDGTHQKGSTSPNSRTKTNRRKKSTNPTDVGSEVARLRAGHRPPLKLYVRFSRIQLSRRHKLRDTIQALPSGASTAPVRLIRASSLLGR